MQADNNFVKTTINNLHEWLPALILKLWVSDLQKECNHKVNAELRKALKPKPKLQPTASSKPPLMT